MALTKAQLVDLNANELIIDLDADTSIHADTDDQIDIKIAGADDFRFTANTFTALSGSTIAAQALTATTLTTTGAIAIANDGNIGSAGDADAIAISSSGVVTFSQTPVLSGASLTAGTTPLTTLDIDGGTDIGAAIADADLFIIDDGAGGTNRKATAARIKSYMGAEGGAFSLANLDIDGATDIGAAIVDADLFIVDDGAGGTNRKTTAARVLTYIESSITTTGALDSGSITSGFGAIDNGTSNIRSATITAETAFVPDAANGATLGTASLEFADLFLHDGAQILFGADQDVLLTHNADAGLTLKTSATGDDTRATLTLQTGETDIAVNDVLGQLFFQAPDEGTGTDAILVAAGISAIAEGDFSSSSNATKLSFRTAVSETATEKMSLSSAGLLTITDDLIIGDDKTIGSASDPDAITIASGGGVTLTQALAGTSADFDGGVTIDNITIDGTEIDLSSGDLTIDVAGDIVLDAGGGDWFYNVAGTNILLVANDSEDVRIKTMVSDKDLKIQGNDGGANINALVFDMSAAGAATFNAGITATTGTFSGVVDADAGVTIDNITIDGTEIDLSSGDLTVDVAGDIILDAGGGDLLFNVATTNILAITNSSSDVIIKPVVDAKDIIFQQRDGTSILEINDGAYARFTAAAVAPEATLSDASTVTWNALTQSVSKVTLGGNRTIGLASGGVSGAFISLLVIQDGTGSRTVSWNAAYEFAADTAPTLTTTANKGDLFVFRYNGAKWLEVGRNLALTLS